MIPRQGRTVRKNRSILNRVSIGLKHGVQKGYNRTRSLRKPSIFSACSNSLPVTAFQFNYNIYDPRGPFLQRWNKYFVVCCLVSISIDPLFFYIPAIDSEKYCLGLDKKLEIVASSLRTATDVFYILHIIFQFRTGFIGPSSQVFSEEVLNEDKQAICKRYICGYLIIDILAILPLPQLVLVLIVPNVKYQGPLVAKETLKWIVFCQFLPRFTRIFPLFKEVTRTSGIFSEKAWVGASLSMFLYLLASHVVGAVWYLLSIGRNNSCWHEACRENLVCAFESLYCNTYQTMNNSFLRDACPPINLDSVDDFTKTFDFGIFVDAIKSGVLERNSFARTFLYCFWWGLRNLSSLGQNLSTSTYEWEICFAICISIIGLLLFSIIIGNMLQKFLPSISANYVARGWLGAKIEEMKAKKQDVKQWMSYRKLPPHLRERITRYEQFKWRQTRGIEEESLLRGLTKGLRKDIKRHLCLDLVRRVPMFEIMDDELLDAMCERLKPTLFTESDYIFREGDPVEEMMFILKGTMESTTTDGGRSGFFKCFLLKAGDFCGEELLPWAFESSTYLPYSTRTVRALAEVEVFALSAKDLKALATQLRRLNSRQLMHTFRFYSQQWRTWATCFIQAAWKRYRRRKMLKSLEEEENRLGNALAKQNEASPSLGPTIYASRFAANALRGLQRTAPSSSARNSAGLFQLPSSPVVFDASLSEL